MPKQKPINVFANVENQKIVGKSNQLRNFWQLVGFCFDSERIEISVSVVSKKRSVRQNRYLWGAVYSAFQQFLAENGDYRKQEDIHNFFKSKFLESGSFPDPATGEIISIPPSTSDKDTFDFAQYVDAIREYCFHNLGLYIMEPDEYYESINQQGIKTNESTRNNY